MDDLITSQTKGEDPETVNSLVLDNCRCNGFPGKLGKFSALTSLSVVNAGLTSLEGFPPLKSLKELQLSDNKLLGGFQALCRCPSLTKLGLAGNRIADLQELKVLAELKELRFLDLLDCPVTNEEDYRSRVFDWMPSLQSLDGLDKDGHEVDSEEEGEEEEEEEGEGEDEDEDDEETGLDALLNDDLGSDSDEGDYDPDQDDEEDEDVSEEDEEPSATKRPKLDDSTPGSAGPSSASD